MDGEADYPSRFAIRFESAEYGGYDGELLLDYPGLSLTVNQGPARMIQFAGALTEFIDETLSFSGSFDSKWGSFLSVDNKLQYDSNLVALALNLLSDEWGTWTMTSSLGDLESSVWRLAAVVEQVYVYTIVIEPEVIIPPPVIEEPIVEAEPEPEPVVEEPVEEEEPAPAAPEDIGELGVDYIEMTVRLDTSLARYESDGGNDAFVEAVCSALGIETSRVTVMEVWEGSVNVRFRVQGGAGLSLEDLQRLLTERFQNGTLDPGYPVLDAGFTTNDPSGATVIIRDGYVIVQDPADHIGWINQNSTALNLDTHCNSKADTLFADEAAREEIEGYFLLECYRRHTCVLSPERMARNFNQLFSPYCQDRINTGHGEPKAPAETDKLSSNQFIFIVGCRKDYSHLPTTQILLHKEEVGILVVIFDVLGIMLTIMVFNNIRQANDDLLEIIDKN